MYHRIFAVSRAFRYQLFVAGGLVLGWWVACTVATLTNCIPLEWSWINSLADPRYCFNYNIFWMASGACEIFLDVLILTLPISVVVRMHLSSKQKFTISGIFLLGGLYVFIITTRSSLSLLIVYIYTNKLPSVIITGLVKVILGYPKGNRVPSYSNTEVWTSVHAGMAIVCASLPTFKPLVNRVSRSVFMVKISSLFSLQRGRESLRSNSDGQMNGSKEKVRESRGSDGNGINGHAKRSPLVTIGGTEMDVGSFNQLAAVTYPERIAPNFRSQREPGQERSEEDHQRKSFPRLPQIKLSEGLELPFLRN